MLFKRAKQFSIFGLGQRWVVTHFVDRRVGLTWVILTHKDQVHTRIHLPEKLVSFAVSPNALWAAGGTPSGHIYIWSIASGQLLNSYDGHYRSVLTLKFTPCSQMLVSTSEDSTAYVWSIARLVDQDPRVSKAMVEPWAKLEGHALAVVCCAVGRAGGPNGVGVRVWTGSIDGTVKVRPLVSAIDSTHLLTIVFRKKKKRCGLSTLQHS